MRRYTFFGLDVHIFSGFLPEKINLKQQAGPGKQQVDAAILARCQS